MLGALDEGMGPATEEVAEGDQQVDEDRYRIGFTMRLNGAHDAPGQPVDASGANVGHGEIRGSTAW